MSQEILFSSEGYEQLVRAIEGAKKKLEEIGQEKRELMGKDIWENGELRGLLEEEKKWVQELANLEELLQRAKVADEPSDDRVGIGTKVRLEFFELEKEEGGQHIIEGIVDGYQITFEKGRISYLSPIGKAIYGAKDGEERMVKLVQGRWRVRIKIIK